MPVHPSSVLSPILDDVPLYNQLTSMEDNTYRLDANGNPSVTGFADYNTYWTAINDAILAHYNAPRPWLDNLPTALYSAIVTSGNLPSVTTYSADNMKLNSIRVSVLAQPISYYNDLPFPVPIGGATPTNLPLLETDILAAITNEEAHFRTAINTLASGVSSFVNTALFGTASISSAYTKQDIANYVYGSKVGELGFKAAIQNNSLVAPTYVP